jgi:hypothetical protein
MAKKGTSQEATPKKKASKKAPEKKAPAKKAEEKKKSGRQKVKADDAPEGLTVETQESGIIAFKEGSGSNDLLKLIAKYGFDREKVLAAATKLKEAGKAFENSDPAKKYSKVAGIIKGLQRAGYKLPEAPAPAKKKAKKNS